MQNVASVTVLVLSLLTMVGGVMGFVKAKSKASLIAGVISGLALAGCFAYSLQAPRDGLMGALFVTGLLDIVFIMRYVKTKKFMPAGMMLLCCIGTQGVLAKALFFS